MMRETFIDLCSVAFLAVFLCAVTACGWCLKENNNQLQQQTALLQQIALQTRAPVSVQKSGFSPEAQQVFNAAVRPTSKRK